MILEGIGSCAPRNVIEQKLAAALGFGPTIRLACQTTVTGDVKLRRLVLDDQDVELVGPIFCVTALVVQRFCIDG